MWACLLPALWLISEVNSASNSQHPNIILILADDSGYSDIDGAHAYTPNIRRLFNEGVEFVNAYVTAPQCSPSRVAILTGSYQQRYGHESNDEFLSALSNPNISIIPKYLPPQYLSAAIGKWNLGDIPNPPTLRGFTEQFLYRDCDQAFEAKRKLELNGSLVSGLEYRTSIMFEQAVSYIRRNVDLPFFLYLAPMSPHPPYVYPPYYQHIYDSFNTSYYSKTRRKVLTMTHELDDGIGSVLRALEETHQDDNTVVFFLNDNGAPDTRNKEDRFNSNYPFSGHKGDLYEGGIHVRFSVRWKGTIAGSRKVFDRVSSLDILPTIIDLTRGARRHQEHSLKYDILDGLSLVDLLGLNRGKHAIGYAVSNVPVARRERCLYWRFSMNCKPQKSAIIKGDLKLLLIEGNLPQLHNLSADIGESLNLYNILTEHAGFLFDKLKLWQVDLPPLPVRLSNSECVKVGWSKHASSVVV